ncbi:MAG: hypothetical protein LKF75_02655 [Bacilli bacterium]|jgi:hypothetical protein|nr:hypothetical protein [Bacilli bacterium]MCH4210787.1 hypothetical protein [Bacilli bacterium]MCH4228588.1 hypothetical protein [Bacilli bacterium]MCH4277884.1 hypothetical protein [Bacilli bacterium]MCI2055311.1 hypothetical protein [Bacilli bacterium]
MEFNKALDGLPKIAKVLIAIFLPIVTIIYRIIADVTANKTVNIVLDILCFFGLAIITWIMDIIDTVTDNRFFLWSDWLK